VIKTILMKYVIEITNAVLDHILQGLEL